MEKILTSRIDEDGHYIEPVYFDFSETEILPDDLIEKPVPEGFYTPKWDGEQWVEGLTAEEIEALHNRPREPTEIELLREKIELSDMALMNFVEIMFGGM